MITRPESGSTVLSCSLLDVDGKGEKYHLLLSCLYESHSSRVKHVPPVVPVIINLLIFCNIFLTITPIKWKIRDE